MNRRLLFTIPFVLMALGLQTAMAQESPAPPRRVPQLSSEDMLPSPSPSPAWVKEPAPDTARSPAVWMRHSFADLGMSIEFVGNPPNPTSMQTQAPDNGQFDRQVKTQVFHRSGWVLSVIQLTSLSRPTLDDLRNFAHGLGDSMGFSKVEYLPGKGADPNFRINGLLNLGSQTWGFRSRFITRGKRIWAVLGQCQQADAPACAEAFHMIDTVNITP